MKSITKMLVLLVVLSMSSFCTIKDSAALKSKFIGLNRENIGVVKGNTLLVYGLNDNMQWEQKSNNTFQIPATAKDMYYDGGDLAVVHTTGKVELFKNEGPGVWRIKPSNEYVKGSFDTPKDAQRILPMGNFIGFAKGKQVEFYYEGWKDHRPEMTFAIPDNAKNYFTCGDSYMVIQTDKGIEFYAYWQGPEDAKASWKHFTKASMKLPAGTTSLLSISGDPCFGVVKGSTVDIYYIHDDRAPELERTFKSTK